VPQFALNTTAFITITLITHDIHEPYIFKEFILKKENICLDDWFFVMHEGRLHVK
jgi:hypothetical protein